MYACNYIRKSRVTKANYYFGWCVHNSSVVIENRENGIPSKGKTEGKKNESGEGKEGKII
jgi:hypothetical protein